jgi:hypothetical protein
MRPNEIEAIYLAVPRDLAIERSRSNQVLWLVTVVFLAAVFAMHG